jgi:flagellar biosynthesis/type III secretory pathway M-ring protein FliF/YscJ
MDQIRLQLQRLANQLSALNASQKMLAASLAAIVILTLWWTTRYASERDMVALFDANLPAEQLSRVTAALDTVGIAYESRAGRIMVPAEKRLAAWSQATYLGVVPENAQNSFDAMLDGVKPWESQGVLKERINRGREIKLTQVMSRWPGIERAEVIIDPRDKVGVSTRIDPSATVSLKTFNRTGGRRLAESAADAVVGAIAGMKRSKVQVTIDGVSFPVRERDDGSVAGGSEIIEMVRSHEDRVVDKIRQHFGFIPGLHVSVTADLNTKTVSEERRTPDPQNKISLPLRETSETNEQTTARAREEPGAVSNIAIPSAVDGSGGGRSTEERSTAEMMSDYGVTRTTTHQPAGDARIIAASVRVPRSYFIEVWKKLNPTITTDPTEEQLKPTIDFELAAIRADVRNITGIEYEAAITVNAYTDLTPMVVGGSATDGAVTAGAGLVAVGYAREIAIGVLALVSLFMVTRMVKKSAPPAPPVRPLGYAEAAAAGASNRPGGPEAIDGNDPIAGVVAEGQPMLFGQEIDPESLEGKQIIDQVSVLVKDNPEMAATLVRKWLKSA